MRFSFIGPAFALACVTSAAVAAQPQTVGRGGGYGGGLIEFMMGAPQANANQILFNHPEAGAEIQSSPPYASPAPVRNDPAPIGSKFQRQVVSYSGPESPGVVVIDTPRKFLFLILPRGQALRYGVGVGRPGFEWAGAKTITRKAEWPSWTPPAEMRLRQPSLPLRMAGGPENPLGARALYLGSSLYRIHGTNAPGTIGRDVSSGCIRMMNADVEDLYERVKVGTKVVVI